MTQKGTKTICRRVTACTILLAAMAAGCPRGTDDLCEACQELGAATARHDDHKRPVTCYANEMTVTVIVDGEIAAMYYHDRDPHQLLVFNPVCIRHNRSGGTAALGGATVVDQIGCAGPK